MTLQPLVPHLTQFVDLGDMPHAKKFYRDNPNQPANKKRWRAKKLAARSRNIAVLDMETDPFDNVGRGKIVPFLGVLYSGNFEPKIIWEADFDKFVERLIDTILDIKEPYTIYAHNGGRFDFMFLIHKMRGEVQFKGRGIMRAKIGIHEVRDSFHIIPEALARWKKDEFKYKLLHKSLRDLHRDEIITYCLNDCKYLLDIVQKFIAEFGFKISIGAAAMGVLRKSYQVKRIGEGFDASMRSFFYGGRVQCLRGAGEFIGPYKSYDKNSMYPAVMSSYAHPIGDFSSYTKRIGDPGPDTVFIDLFCVNRNALVGRDETGATSTLIKDGQFFTTIWEYTTALKHGLIDPWNINCCYDTTERTDFSQFVLPLYERRLVTKNWLKDHGEDNPHYWEMKKDDTFIKLILNNAYGKFAINPRNFKCHYITDPDGIPELEWMASIQELPPAERAEYIQPEYKGATYWIWSKPAPGMFYNNVCTAASITGAARAELMDALQSADDPIYCDTDSIVCRGLRAGDNLVIDPARLGAWKLEDEFSAVRITGKKQYAGRYAAPRPVGGGQLSRYKIRSKGASGLEWDDFDTLLRGEVVAKAARAPTFDRFGGQNYIDRNLRMTAERFVA